VSSTSQLFQQNALLQSLVRLTAIIYRASDQDNNGSGTACKARRDCAAGTPECGLIHIEKDDETNADAALQLANLNALIITGITPMVARVRDQFRAIPNRVWW
jgi:hypothetical protein